MEALGALLQGFLFSFSSFFPFLSLCLISLYDKTYWAQFPRCAFLHTCLACWDSSVCSVLSDWRGPWPPEPTKGSSDWLTRSFRKGIGLWTLCIVFPSCLFLWLSQCYEAPELQLLLSPSIKDRHHIKKSSVLSQTHPLSSHELKASTGSDN